MVCSNCGTDIDDSLEFCPNCSVRNENYKNPFISSNTDIGNVATGDSFSTESIDSTQKDTGEVAKTDENANLGNTANSNSEEGSSSDIDNSNSTINNDSNTLPPIENISTNSNEIFKSDDIATNSASNISQSGSGEVFRSEEVPEEKKKFSKKNKILIVGGVVILVIILFVLFILNTILAKSPQYVVAKMLQQESSIKESHIKYNLNINGNSQYGTGSYFTKLTTNLNLQGSLNIQKGTGGIVKYDGINSLLGSVKTSNLGTSFSLDVSSRSEYYKNKLYLEFTKLEPQLLSSLLKLSLNSWEETSIQKQQVNKFMNFKIPDFKNIKVTEIGYTTINNVQVTEYSVLLSSKTIENSLPKGLQYLNYAGLNKNIKLYLWINTSNYYLYKLALSTRAREENINLSMNFSNINKPFNILIPSSYTKSVF